MTKILEAVQFNKLMDEANLQYSVDRGFHLNSSAWEGYINLKDVNIFNFLVTGIISTRTYSSHSGKNYYQGFKNTDFKKIELLAFYLFLCKLNPNIIKQFLAQTMTLCNWKVYCNCESFLYWGWKYKLTRLNSVLGPGESRRPKKNNVGLMKQNNIVCKHLWQVINTLDENMELFLENLIPYYKKMYGFSKNGSEDMLLKQIGATGFRKAYEDCKNVLFKMDRRIGIVFDSITKRQSTIILKKLEEIKNKKESVKEKVPEEKKEVEPKTYSKEELIEKNRLMKEKREKTLQEKKEREEKFKSMQNDELKDEINNYEKIR